MSDGLQQNQEGKQPTLRKQRDEDARHRQVGAFADIHRQKRLRQRGAYELVQDKHGFCVGQNGKIPLSRVQTEDCARQHDDFVNGVPQKNDGMTMPGLCKHKPKPRKGDGEE